jgi:hypothetical protein
VDLSKITNAVTRVAGNQMLTAQKNSPTIMLVGGVVGMVGTVVLASKATLKLEAVLDESISNTERAHEARATKAEVYSEQDLKKDLAVIKVKTAVNIAKLYGPAIILGVASISLLVGGQNVLIKRNIAIAGALKTVEGQFKEYRKRVENELGTDKARELEEGYTVEVEDEKGKKNKVKVHAPMGKSPYAAVFDELSSTQWRSHEENGNYNSIFLSAQQTWATERLRARGYLFLNDVFDALGMERTPAGQIVGWYYDPSDELRDNYVSFGVFDRDDERGADFVNGLEDSILLDFNVDGPVYELLDQAKKRR